MNKDDSKKMFERYNPASEVVRCPRGSSDKRRELDAYAKAAVNLYGLISREELAAIYNQQNDDQTAGEEIYRLLLPLVLKKAGYGFYKDYLVNSSFFDDFRQAEDLLAKQSNKPRYIPSKTEFLRYIHEEYVYNELEKLRDFLAHEPDLGSNPSVIVGEIMDRVINGIGFSQLGSILERRGVIFSGEEKLQEFLKLVQEVNNNTRRWDNKGYTPSELYELTKEDRKAEPEAKSFQRSKVGRNDPCPCGSGKKFKKCCGVYDDAKTAQLTAEECKEFYEIWYGLMGYVNDREQVIWEKIRPVYPNPVSDVKIYQVREALWKKPQLIDEYISQADLPQATIEILKLWRTKHKKGIVFLVEYQREFAVALASNEQKEDILYGIKGISTSLANTMRRILPAPIDTVLLPFKGKIIYDSYLNSLQVGFAEGAKASIREMYENVRSQGITTSLE